MRETPSLPFGTAIRLSRKGGPLSDWQSSDRSYWKRTDDEQLPIVSKGASVGDAKTKHREPRRDTNRGRAYDNFGVSGTGCSWVGREICQRFGNTIMDKLIL